MQTLLYCWLLSDSHRRKMVHIPNVPTHRTRAALLAIVDHSMECGPVQKFAVTMQLNAMIHPVAKLSTR